jgi:hypothetical protein
MARFSGCRPRRSCRRRGKSLSYSVVTRYREVKLEVECYRFLHSLEDRGCSLDFRSVGNSLSLASRRSLKSTCDDRAGSEYWGVVEMQSWTDWRLVRADPRLTVQTGLTSRPPRKLTTLLYSFRRRRGFLWWLDCRWSFRACGCDRCYFRKTCWVHLKPYRPSVGSTTCAGRPTWAGD